MYVAVIPNRGSPPAILLRESYREAGKTRNRTLANLSRWPAERIDQLRAVLRHHQKTKTHDQRLPFSSGFISLNQKSNSSRKRTNFLRNELTHRARYIRVDKSFATVCGLRDGEERIVQGPTESNITRVSELAEQIFHSGVKVPDLDSCITLKSPIDFFS
jgi:hypothetical protein